MQPSAYLTPAPSSFEVWRFVPSYLTPASPIPQSYVAVTERGSIGLSIPVLWMNGRSEQFIPHPLLDSYLATKS